MIDDRPGATLAKVGNDLFFTRRAQRGESSSQFNVLHFGLETARINLPEHQKRLLKQAIGCIESVRKQRPANMLRNEGLDFLLQDTQHVLSVTAHPPARWN